jgi:hypothetical protein
MLRPVAGSERDTGGSEPSQPSPILLDLSSPVTAACGVMFAMDGEADAMVGDAGPSNAPSSSWTEAGIRLGSSMGDGQVSRSEVERRASRRLLALSA